MRVFFTTAFFCLGLSAFVCLDAFAQTNVNALDGRTEQNTKSQQAPATPGATQPNPADPALPVPAQPVAPGQHALPGAAPTSASPERAPTGGPRRSGLNYDAKADNQREKARRRIMHLRSKASRDRIKANKLYERAGKLERQALDIEQQIQKPAGSQ